MPSFRSTSSPRLRATHALPLAIIILLGVLFGTPGRDDSRLARAQSPVSPLQAPRGRAASAGGPIANSRGGHRGVSRTRRAPRP